MIGLIRLGSTISLWSLCRVKTWMFISRNRVGLMSLTEFRKLVDN